MAGIWPAIIQGVGAIGGGLLSSSGQSSANSMSNKMALRQMAFQKWMAQHAHQNEVADLRAAGLNPILSATGGSGAATPSGSAPTYENEKSVGVSTALDALAKITSSMLTREQTEQTKANTENTIARTTTERNQPGLIRAQTENVMEQANSARETQQNIAADTRLKIIGAQVSLSELDKNRELVKLFRAQGLTEKQQAYLYSVNADQAVEVLKGLRNQGDINSSDFGKVMSYIDRALESVNKIPIIGKGKGR